MASPEFKQQAARLKQALANKYEQREKTSVAGPVGDGKLYIGGQIFDGSITGVTRVVNEGRRASASYVAKNGGSSSSTGGSSSGGSSGGAPVSPGTGAYLPLDGSIAMSGNLNMGNYGIINVSTVDGRDLQADGVILDGIKNASIITMTADANLVNERVLTVTPSLTLSDGGAGGNAVLGMTTPGSLTVTSANDSTSAAHTHSVVHSNNPGAQAMILSSASDGSLIVTAFGATTSVTTPLVQSALNMTIRPNATLLVEAGAGTSPITFSPAKRSTLSPFETRIGSDDYASKTTGWAVEHWGAADFRYLYVDEMHAKVFIADLEQALAGGQIIAKSVTLTYLDFTAPSAGGTTTLTVRDLPSATGMAVFQNGDIIRLRNFSRAAGSLSITNCWGVVTLDTSYGTGGFDATTKSQRYTFVRSAGYLGGAMTAGTVVAAESIVLDYGVSGNGYYEVDAIDGYYAANSPYSQIVTWTVHPASTEPGEGLDVKVRLGNLNGITDPNLSPTGYGLYSDNVFLTGSIAAADGEILIDSDGVRVRATELVDFDNLNAYRIESSDSTVMGGLYGRHYAGAYTVNVHSFGTSTINAYTELRSTAGTGKWANVYLYASNLSQTHDASLLAFADDTESYIRIDASEDDGRIEMRSPVYAYFDVLPYLGGKNLGSTTWEWDTLYVNQIVVSGAISGDTMSGQEWEYPGNMTIDSNSASDTTVSVINSGAGGVTLNVVGTITQSGTAVSLSGHTHSTYLLKAGDTISGNITVASGVTIDGVDISAHAVDANAHHARAHSLTSASDHTITGSQWQILGLTATNTIGLLDSSNNPGAAANILRTDAAGTLALVKLRSPLIDTASGDLTLSPASGGVVFSGSRPVVISGGVGVGITKQGDGGGWTFGFHAKGNAGTDLGGFGFYGTADALVKYYIGPSYTAAHLSVLVNGNVLVGTQTDTGYKFRVVGNTHVTGNAIIDGSLGVGATSPEGLQVATAINEATRGISLRAGLMEGLPRIIFDDGTTATSWQLDTFGGAFRIFRSGNVAVTVDNVNAVDFYGDIASPDYASQATGWRVDRLGGADFRYVYTTELHAKTFIADLEQALAGSQIITKSVTTVNAAFAVPFPGGTGYLYVDDLPSAEGMGVFQSGDFVRLRQMSRAGGGLSISDVWGTVTNYVDQADKVQRWEFTRSVGSATYTVPNYITAPTNTTTAGATSRSATKPTGTASGQCMVAFVVVGTTSAVITPPAGWTVLAFGTVTGVKAEVHFKVSSGSEPSSYTWNFSTSTAASVTIANYGALAWISSGGVNEVSTASTSIATPPSLYMSPDDTYVVFSALAGNVRVTPSGGLTELIDAGVGSIGAYMAHVRDVGPGQRTAIGGTAASSVRSVSIGVHLVGGYATGGLSSLTGHANPMTAIAAGTLALDYGVSGNGYIETTAVDGVYGVNSPYQRIATWTTHPSNIAVRTQVGNLYGILGEAGEYGFFGGTGTGPADSYVRLSSYISEFRNIPVNVYQTSAKRLEISPTDGISIRVDPSISTLNSQIISWYADLDAKSVLAKAYLFVYTNSSVNRMLLRVTNDGATASGLFLQTPLAYIGLGDYDIGKSGHVSSVTIAANDTVNIQATNGVNFYGADLYGVDHVLASSGFFGTHYAYDVTSKGTRIYGPGFDGTRYFAAAVGLNMSWNTTGYRFGTDGGSNGSALILAEGTGDTLTFYTRTNDGAYSSTITAAALTSLKRMTISDSGVVVNQRLAVGGTGYSSGLVVVESNAVYSGITSVLTTSGGSPGSVIRAIGAGLAPIQYDFYRWYSAYGPTEGGIRAHTFAGSWGTTIWADNTIALRAGGYADNVAAGLVILTTGNTGIGVAVPSYKLDVSGAAHASSFPTSSDARFKERLVPLSKMLDKVSKLDSYTFYWRENYASYDQFLDADGNPIKQIGFVAQEVDSLFPELISRWSHTGRDGVTTSDAYSVDYARMTAILVQATRELRDEKDAQLGELRKELFALRNELAALRSEQDQ